ncbi:MAG: hypothetical protein Rhirs2KO_18980 [Rhizobiaceae bacterium]
MRRRTFLGASLGASAAALGPSALGRATAEGARLIAPQQAVTSIAFSPDGSYLAFSAGSAVSLWDLRPGQFGQVWHGGAHGAPWVVRAVRFVGDNLLASVGDDRIIAISEASSGEVLYQAVQDISVGALASPSDGAIVVSGDAAGRIRIWNPEGLEELGTLQGHRFGLTSLSFDLAGTRLLSTAADQRCFLWNTEDQTETVQLISGEHGNRAHFGIVTGAGFVPGSDCILTTATWDGAAHVARTSGYEYRSVGDDCARLWTAADGALRAEANPQWGIHAMSMPLSGDKAAILTLPGYTPYGLPQLMTLSDLSVQDADVGVSQIACTSVMHTPDGALVALGSVDGSITLASAADLAPLARLTGSAGGFAFEACGKVYASGLTPPIEGTAWAAFLADSAIEAVMSGEAC